MLLEECIPGTEENSSQSLEIRGHSKHFLGFVYYI